MRPCRRRARGHRVRRAAARRDSAVRRVPHRLSLDDPIWRSAQDALFHAPTAANDSVYRAGTPQRGAKRRVAQHGEHFPDVGARRRRHRRDAGESHRHGRRAREPALPLGAVRRPAHVPAGHARRGRSDTRHALAVSEGGCAAQALPPRASASPSFRRRSTPTRAPSLGRRSSDGAPAAPWASSSRPRICAPSTSTIPTPQPHARSYARYVAGGVADARRVQDARGLPDARDRQRRRGACDLTIQIHTLETFGGYYASARCGTAPARAAVQRLDTPRDEVRHRPRRLAAHRRDAGAACRSRTCTPTSR